jgi:hypothetical protein
MYNQPHLARETAVGRFYPLSAYLVGLYGHRLVDRGIFSILAELDRLLPPERHITSEDIEQFCRTLGKAKPSATAEPTAAEVG